MNNYLDYKRFLFLCKNEIVSNYKSWLIYFLTIIGIYSVFSVAVIGISQLNFTYYDKNSLNGLFPGFLFIGGFIVSSLTFSDVNDKFKNSLWLSTPGSSLEKYLVGLTISSIGYTIFLITSFFIASLISRLITIPIFDASLDLFNPVGLNYMKYTIPVYLLTNSLFLVGSITFKKGAFIKTILATTIIQILLFITLIIIFYITTELGVMNRWDIRLTQKIFDSIVEDISRENYLFIPGILFCIFFNIVGYFKLTEKEVKGGV